jgi:hypothetical protein
VALKVLVAAILFAPAVMAVGVLVCAGAGLLLDAWRCRHPPADLLEHLQAFSPASVADEAERWLQSQRG